MIFLFVRFIIYFCCTYVLGLKTIPFFARIAFSLFLAYSTFHVLDVGSVNDSSSLLNDIIAFDFNSKITFLDIIYFVSSSLVVFILFFSFIFVARTIASYFSIYLQLSLLSKRHEEEPINIFENIVLLFGAAIIFSPYYLENYFNLLNNLKYTSENFSSAASINLITKVVSWAMFSSLFVCTPLFLILVFHNSIYFVTAKLSPELAVNTHQLISKLLALLFALTMFYSMLNIEFFAW